MIANFGDILVKHIHFVKNSLLTDSKVKYLP